MKQKIVTGLSLFLLIGLFSCSSDFQGQLTFNENWKFKILKDSSLDDNNFHEIDYLDADWDDINLPHTANIEPLIVNEQWQGTCWYRKYFELAPNLKNKQILIEFEAAMSHAEVWLNGNKVATHKGGYLPFVIDASKYLKSGSENLIAIRLINVDDPLIGPKALKILDFNMYGGLYRNARLIIKDKVHISHPLLAKKTAGGGIFITTPKVDKEESIVNIKSHILNGSDKSRKIQLQQAVYSQGKMLQEVMSDEIVLKEGEEYEFIQDIVIKNAKLWSPENPDMYKLRTVLKADGKLVDEENNRFGIREFEFIDNKLYINGVKTFLRGVNRHQEYPFIGYALSDNAQYRDAKKIKDAGFNCIRLSHYPHSPAFMDACDELGIIVLDAILGWQYYLDDERFREYCYRSARELVLRDRNHPCVLAWEVSLNESNMPVFFREKLNEIAHEEYPGSNVYSCGWMNEGYDIYLQARQHRIQDHYDSVQTKPYFVSEYGDWEYFAQNKGLNQHELARDMRIAQSSRQLRSFGEKRLLQQAYNIQEAHNDNYNTSAFGDAYWVMFDYNRGYSDDLEASGIMDIFRIPKFSYYFYKSQKKLTRDTVLKIASYWDDKSALDVKIYSNCDEVELFINGYSVGKQMPDRDVNSSNLDHPPFTFSVDEFEVGELKAIGYAEGKIIAEELVKTPSEPVALKMWLDESGKKAKAACNDVMFLYIAAIDENGSIVPDFDDIIELCSPSERCSLGEHTSLGELLVLNTGVIKAEAGIATALIKIGKSKAMVEISAKAEGLESRMLTFSIE